MSHARRAARRDSNEKAIVAALTAAGASVSFLSGVDGIPDLLVGYDARTHLLEVKAPLGPKGGGHANSTSLKSRGGDGTRTKDQVDWWAAWRGAPPVIVRTPEEALAAIGAAPAGGRE